jgi:ATP-dependent 26S proteasome regulatory subunit
MPTLALGLYAFKLQDFLVLVAGKCAVIKTSTRQTYFLPVIGLVDPEDMKPGDLVGVNKDSYLILEKLPAEYDSRVKAMEVDSRYTLSLKLQLGHFYIHLTEVSRFFIVLALALQMSWSSILGEMVNLQNVNH